MPRRPAAYPVRRHSTLGYVSPIEFEQAVAEPCVHGTRDSSGGRESLRWSLAVESVVRTT
jgi:hypothetical protein